MELTLPRFAYTPTDTQGILQADQFSCFTIEPPWIRGDYPGGMPFKSCVPDGTYDLVPYIRPNRRRDKVFVLVNPDLGVYFDKPDRPVDDQGIAHGRFLCEIHSANYAHELRGCIAPGRERLIDPKKLLLKVVPSRPLMAELIALIGWVPGHTLRIFQAPGAIDTPLAVLPAAD